MNRLMNASAIYKIENRTVFMSSYSTLLVCMHFARFGPKLHKFLTKACRFTFAFLSNHIVFLLPVQMRERRVLQVKVWKPLVLH